MATSGDVEKGLHADSKNESEKKVETSERRASRECRRQMFEFRMVLARLELQSVNKRENA